MVQIRSALTRKFPTNQLGRSAKKKSLKLLDFRLVSYFCFSRMFERFSYIIKEILKHTTNIKH